MFDSSLCGRKYRTKRLLCSHFTRVYGGQNNNFRSLQLRKLSDGEWFCTDIKDYNVSYSSFKSDNVCYVFKFYFELPYCTEDIFKAAPKL